MASAQLAKVFDDMSRERDKPTNTRTSGSIRAVEGGYEQEIVSTSSPRPRYGHGDQVETVTRRTVRSMASPERTAEATFALRTGSSSSASRRTTTAADSVPAAPVAPTTPRSTRSLSGVIPPAPTGARADTSSTPNYVGSRPLPSASPNSLRTDASPATGTMNWQRTPRPAQPVTDFSRVPAPTYAAASTRSVSQTSTTIYDSTPVSAMRRGRDRQPRSLNFGQTETRVVEPSRMTPLRVEQEYAPVKYVTKAELRFLRQQRGQQRTVAGSIRTSSVPRLDAIRREQEMEARHRSRSRSNPGSVGGGGGGVGYTAQEQAFRGQPPLPDIAPQEPYGASPAPKQPQQFWGPGNTVASPRRSGSAPQRYPERQPQYHQRGGSDYDDDDRRSVSSVGSRRSMSSVVTAASLAADAPRGSSIREFGAMLCRARGLGSPPSPPAYAADAFLLLQKGTYLVKYGRGGQPHERWLTLRIMHDEQGRAQPYLAWALHHESATIKDRINLTHLFDATAGVTGPNFERHLVGPNALRGPHVGSKASTLPTDFALRFHFQSQATGRSIDVLALDDQTCRCWLLVMRYFASINTSANGTAPVDVETLAPESVRSGSNASRR